MKSTVGESPNPLGLNLDFMFGRGYLWAQHERLSDWITLESLRMEIPDLSFPFDARGGLDRFHNTRCLVREIGIGISEVGLGDLLRRAAQDLERFEDLQVTFLEDAIHVSVKVSAFGSDTYVSFRAAPIPPEPARADEIHLSLYDYRAYGPLPFPARLVAFELATGLLNTPLLRPPGRGSSFTVGVAGDILRLRPLKLLLLHIFPPVGWKLPNLSDITLDGARVRPGAFSIRAVSHDDDYRGDKSSDFELGSTREGMRALAAYEAKNLFVGADEALFDGQIRQALELFAGYRDLYGLHSDLVARWLDCLIAQPSAANVAEARALCNEVEEEDPNDLNALLARPTLALIADDEDEAVEAYDRLSGVLRERGETPDWILCQIAAAQQLADDKPEEAADRLRQVLKVSPRNRVALESLRELYVRLGDRAGLEEVLKRLTGVYTDRETLKRTYLDLAHHLLDREGELAEARLYLEKVLRLDPSQLEALDTLGQSYVLSGEPLRALKAFGSAARAAEANDEPDRAANLQYRVAQLWYDELGDVDQALLSCRRALSLWDKKRAEPTSDQRLRVLEFAAQLCAERDHLEEATDYWMQAVPLLEEAYERTGNGRARRFGGAGDGRSPGDEDAQLRARLVAAHGALGELYRERSRFEAAAPHFRRMLEIDPDDRTAAERLAEHYRNAGQLEKLVELYDELASRCESAERRVAVRLEMGELYESTPNIADILGEESFDALAGAANAYEEALQIEPGNLAALRKLVNVLESLIERDGAKAQAPTGSGTVGGLLEECLKKQAEQEPDPADQGYAYERLASLAHHRGDEAGAEQARRLAEDAFRRAHQPPSDEVDARLDEILDEINGGADDASEEPNRGRASLPSPRDLAARSEAEVSPDPVDLSGDQEGLDDDSDTEEFEVPESVDEPAPTEETSGPERERLSGFRKRYRELFDERPSTRRVGNPPPADEEAPADEAATGASELQRAVAQARSQDDPTRLADALEALVAAHDNADDSLRLDEDKLADVSLELGELCYYDLEEASRARSHLERVRSLDPDDRGSRPVVVNTLEAIYEESGAVDERLELLEAKLENADSEEMAVTYRLLLAQLVWDERGDAEAATGYLRGVLEHDPKHEAAHRLLGRIAHSRGDFEGAADHLRTVVEVAGGGLDALESERQLADLLFDELERPGEAIEHYEHLLEAAPADSGALERIKECRAALEDWSGYLAALGRELGLLIGRPAGLDVAKMSELDPEAIASAVRVPASQILADAAHVAEEELGRADLAHRLWGTAFRLWPEHVEALERRIALDRTLDKVDALANDLEDYAELLLDSHARFEALYEAAYLQAKKLERPKPARQLLAEAIALVQDDPDPPERLARARRALRALQRQQES